MRFVVICILGLLLAGCGDSKPKSKKYSYVSAKNESYTLELSENHIKILVDSNQLKGVVFLVFLDYECQNCQFYYEHLNHLALSHKNLQIIGILPTQSGQIQDFIKSNHIDFELITPKREKDASILQAILESRMPKIDQLSIQSDSLESHLTISDSIQSTNNTQSIDSPPVSQDELELPFFVLYTPNGEIYQDYRGFIPEEIFSSDIEQMLN